MPEITEEYRRDRRQFEATARERTRKHATTKTAVLAAGDQAQEENAVKEENTVKEESPDPDHPSKESSEAKPTKRARLSLK
mmetsp:Transcript_47425/g.111633  ORF Transcript_47425/g.111633 Transcript_47425/m.111633 type:complete len:81 (+) Transcript_47425:447-689(+)